MRRSQFELRLHAGDFDVGRTLRQSRLDPCPGMQCVRIAYGMALGVEQHRIAALQRALRRQQLDRKSVV